MQNSKLGRLCKLKDNFSLYTAILPFKLYTLNFRLRQEYNEKIEDRAGTAAD
jgi:hypothetical protein